MHSFKEGGWSHECQGTDTGTCHGFRIEYFCDIWHNECGSGGVGLHLEEAVRAEDLTTIRDLIASGAAVVNPARRSVQVFDCEGDHVTMNIPLPEGVYLALPE